MISPLERVLAQLTIASESGSLVLVFNRDLAKLIALAEAVTRYRDGDATCTEDELWAGVTRAHDALTADDAKGGGE